MPLSFKQYLKAAPVEKEPTKTEESKDRYFERAEEHFFAERYNTSLALFLKVLESNPEDGRAHSYCGDIYLIQGNLDRAMHHFRIAAEVGPEKHKALFRMGQIAYLRKDARSANEYLQQSLDLSPDFAPSVFYLGLVAWKLEDQKTEAAIQWEKYLSLRPQDPQKVAIREAIAFLRKPPAAESKEETNNPSEENAQESAPVDLDRLLRSVDPARPGSDASTTPGSVQNPAQDGAKEQATDNAENTQKNEVDKTNDPEVTKESGSETSVSDLDKNNTDATDPGSSAKTDVKNNQENDEVAAIARSLQGNPERLSTILNLAEIFRDQGQSDKAEKLLEASAKYNDSPKLHTALAEQKAKNGKEKEAREILRKQIQRKDLGESSKSSAALALARLSDSNDPAAKEDYSLAMEQLSRNQSFQSLSSAEQNEYRTLLGRDAFQAGNTAEAYKQALQILKQDPSDRKGLILAAQVAKTSNTPTSFEVYEERIRSVYGKDPDMMTALAEIYSRDDAEKAAKILQEVARDNPDHLPSQIALYRMELSANPDRARNRLQSLVNKHPENSQVLALYIDAEIAAGHRSDALLNLLRRAYRKEQSAPGSFPLLNQWMKQLSPEDAKSVQEPAAKDPSQDPSKEEKAPGKGEQVP
ncbi:MAG: tetratricopeptide repeat protein [Leptospiraceae bacterium]|nr:tetratricopeptide repeat protein [Leptospiraceae bacterium]